MQPDWGRFTLRGGAAVEARLVAMVREVADAFEACLPREMVRALALIGGYGRGEGGIERRDGVEKPHNNLDFLLVARGSTVPDPATLKTTLDAVLQPISRRWEIGMDLGVVTDSKLRHSPCLVMWHDMRFGHKTVLGDRTFVPSLTRFTPEAIVPADIRNLLVNRGTLLVINQLLLERGRLFPEERRVLVKHAMKAVIGYGDALLFSEGAYHWSYAEKQRRMRTCRAASAGFRQAYEDAMEFRFEPCYERFLERDPASLAGDLLALLEPVHLACEARRVGLARPEWGAYPGAALARALVGGLTSPREVAKKLLHLATFQPARGGLGCMSHLGSRVSGMAGILPIAFPVVAYGLRDPRYRAWVAAVLRTDEASDAQIRAAYLQEWGRHGDLNFPLFLQRLGLDSAHEKGRPA